MRPAQAMGVRFTLPETTIPNATAFKQIAVPTEDVQVTASTFSPLPIPTAAVRPPVGTKQEKSLPENVIPSTRILPAPLAEALPTSRVMAPLKTNASIAEIETEEDQIAGLIFSSPESRLPPGEKPRQDIATSTSVATPSIPHWIYSGGANSLVARVIGSAEGTRAANGQPTPAYYGHTDPGNGVWNMGTFSYQHRANSPEEADHKQLKRLKHQGQALSHQAHQAELTMTLGEILNGLDLANQAPLAALDQGGYVDRLAQAHRQGMRSREAIIWARTYAYLDPKTQRWNAPGLGNTLRSISHDQQRRHDAVAQAFNSYQAELPLHSFTEPLSLETTEINNNLTSPTFDSNTAVVQKYTLPVTTEPSKAKLPVEITPVDFTVASAGLSQKKDLGQRYEHPDNNLAPAARDIDLPVLTDNDMLSLTNQSS